MSKIAWPKLMQVGLQHLRLSPDQFWDLTPAELMLMAGDSTEVSTLSRDGFADLHARYPDNS